MPWRPLKLLSIQVTIYLERGRFPVLTTCLAFGRVVSILFNVELISQARDIN
jgi:hypothetical protein